MVGGVIYSTGFGATDDEQFEKGDFGLDAWIGTDVSKYKRLPLLSGFRAYAVSTLVNVISV